MHISGPINRNIYCPIGGRCSIALGILKKCNSNKMIDNRFGINYSLLNVYQLFLG